MLRILQSKPNKKTIILRGLVLFFLCLYPLPAFALSNPVVKTGSASPDLGSFTHGQTITFTTTFNDSRGVRDIESARFTVSNFFLFAWKCFYGQYNPDTNKLYILDDSGRRLLGGFHPGADRKMENSYCRLDCSQSSVIASGNTLTVKWAVSFKSKFSGTKNLYLYVRGRKSGFDGWNKKGTIRIAPDLTPPTGTIKINNGSFYTKSALVTLDLSAEDNPEGSGVSQMQFSNDNLGWSAAETYAVSKNWVLIPGDGVKTVYAKFKDVYGNWSEIYSDTITLDTTAPQLNTISPVDNQVVRP
ncbi:MAG: hypothetical protein ABH914_02495 [Candidatus Omnitrophota bacterium]